MNSIQALYQFFLSFCGTVAFAMLFHLPVKQYIASGIVGATGWVVYTLMMQLQSSTAVASLVAVLPLTALARLFATRRKAPITLFLLCGIFPLVPGAGIYYTAYYFITDQRDLTAIKGAETLQIAGALALGIVLVLSLPSRLFQPFFRSAILQKKN